jgi:TPR repeat protein
LLFLGDIYRNGLHGQRDIEVARQLYNRAREAGVTDADDRLREMDGR